MNLRPKMTTSPTTGRRGGGGGRGKLRRGIEGKDWRNIYNDGSAEDDWASFLAGVGPSDHLTAIGLVNLSNVLCVGYRKRRDEERDEEESGDDDSEMSKSDLAKKGAKWLIG